MKKVNIMKIIKIVGIPVLIILVACVITIWVLKERRDNLLINPAIYPAFRKIEIRALLYTQQEEVNKEEYERCRAVVDRMGYSHSSESAEEYYIYLSGLGFNLPPFKLKNPPTEEQKKQCMMEADRLLELQTKITEGQISQQSTDMEAMIKSQKIE